MLESRTVLILRSHHDYFHFLLTQKLLRNKLLINKTLSGHFVERERFSFLSTYFFPFLVASSFPAVLEDASESPPKIPANPTL